MKINVQQHVRACQKCFVTNPKISKEAPALNSIPVSGKVWSLVGIDMIGPLQETSNGNKYIVAATDHFSKWTEATAVPDKSAKSVHTFFVLCYFPPWLYGHWLATRDESLWTQSSTPWWSIFKQITAFHLPTTHKQMANGKVTIEHSKSLLVSLLMTKETTRTS